MIFGSEKDGRKKNVQIDYDKVEEWGGIKHSHLR